MTDPDVDLGNWPRLPVFGWAAFSGAKRSGLPCILDAPQVAFTFSGRAAIALALRDLGIGPGDEVLVPTYHCPTMIAPVAAVGARPLFFPIDASGAPRMDVIAGMSLGAVRAIIVAHYFGIPQPMAAIRRFCDDRGIALIEDCAHAMFGHADGRPIGRWGDYAIASLTKFFPTADGGCLVVAKHDRVLPTASRRVVVDELRSIANTLEMGAKHRGLSGLNRALTAGFALADVLRGTTRLNGRARSNKRMSEVTADPMLWRQASAWSQFIARAAHRERIIEIRRRNYAHLAVRLADIPGTRVLWPKLPISAVPYVFPLWVDAPADSYQRVRRAGVPIFRWDDVWFDVPEIAGDHGADWAVRVFQLGCHQDLDLDGLDLMADTLRQIFSSIKR